VVPLDRKRLSWGRNSSRGKPDACAAECDAEFLAWGCSLVTLDATGDGVPDRIVAIAGVDQLVEYKVPKAPMRPAQVVFIAHWRGRPVVVVRSREDARRLVGELRQAATMARSRVA